MKAKLLALASLASLFFLNGCNGIGDKDTILARIDKEKVYQEDYALLLKNTGNPDKDKGKFLYDNLYSRAALVSKALSEFPELEDDWKEAYKNLKPRILTMVFQRFYIMECLKFDDKSLKQYYEMNRSLFKSDSASDFYSERGLVAETYYLSKNQEKWQAFLDENVQKSKSPKTDTLVLKRRFVDEYRNYLRDSISNLIENGTDLDIHEISQPDAKTYYDRHKDSYMTVPGYEVYHIQGRNKDSLANLFETKPSLDLFKQKAAAVSLNKITSLDSGYVGVVKQNYALPYGIGMVPALSLELKNREAGFVTTPLLDEWGRYHLFYLVAQVPSKLKPYDRVRTSIEIGLKSGDLFDVDSSFVLISRKGTPLLTERELLHYNEQFSNVRLVKSSHDRLVRMCAEFLAFENLAEKERLNHSWEFRAIVRDARWDFILRNYTQKAKNLDRFSEDSLRAIYGSMDKSELQSIASIPKNMYRYEYYMGYRLVSFGKSLEQCVPGIYARIRSEYDRNWLARRMAEAYDAATVHIYSTDVPEYKPEMLADVLLKKADSLYKAGNRSAAIDEYRKLQIAYADVDSLIEKAIYEKALIQSENDDFRDAEAGYFAYYRIWPDSPNAEKAMFSRGFILSEDLGNNGRALDVFEEFLQKYPNSELKESAQWLLDNIKSDGKLADELMKKIEAEE